MIVAGLGYSSGDCVVANWRCYWNHGCRILIDSADTFYSNVYLVMMTISGDNKIPYRHRNDGVVSTSQASTFEDVDGRLPGTVWGCYNPGSAGVGISAASFGHASKT